MIEYKVSYRNNDTRKRFKKKVFGEIVPNFLIQGIFAVRQTGEASWTVDHVETGLAVATGKTKKEAISRAFDVAKQQGHRGFDKAIARAKEMRITVAQL